eukprot:scaffold4723_cov172-Amphora_coffeaeformis.AAC.8
MEWDVGPSFYPLDKFGNSLPEMGRGFCGWWWFPLPEGKKREKWAIHEFKLTFSRDPETYLRSPQLRRASRHPTRNTASPP